MGLSSCIILLGSGLIYNYTGLTNLESIYSLVSVYLDSISFQNLSLLEQVSTLPSRENLSLIYNNGSLPRYALEAYSSSEIRGISLGVLLVFSGFLFKIAASPFHNWSPALLFGKKRMWDKLSNSGDSLKLLIPSHK